jgi:hypothetical protein
MTVGGLKPNYALRSLIQRHNAAPQVTVVPVQPPTQVELDHYYALEVFQQQTVGYTSIPVAKPHNTGPVPVVQTPAQKRMMILCGLIAVVVILAIFIHFL